MNSYRISVDSQQIINHYFRPPVGSPAANKTFKPSDISQNTIDFSRALPGTRYEFWLYYSNTSITDWLTWTASITTAPDPPTDLNVDVQSGEKAIISWEPPLVGMYSGFKLKVIPLSEPFIIRNLIIHETQSTLSGLSAGATYEIQLYTMYENKESQDYIATNFTSRPLRTRPSPVRNLVVETDEMTEEIILSWDVDRESQQDSFKVFAWFGKYIKEIVID